MVKEVKVLLTGSRNYSDGSFIEGVLRSFQEAGRKRYPDAEFLLIVGDAQGADALGAQAAKRLGWGVEVHVAQWSEQGRKAGILRNLEMIAREPIVCFAFPIGESRGTRHCISAAEKQGIKTYVY